MCKNIFMHCYHRLYLFIVFIDYHKNNPAKKYQIFKGKTHKCLQHLGEASYILNLSKGEER